MPTPKPKILLLDSEHLTHEEEQLRAELVEWCKAKFAEGRNSIPMQAALLIVGKRMMDDPDKYGLR